MLYLDAFWYHTTLYKATLNEIQMTLELWQLHCADVANPWKKSLALAETNQPGRGISQFS